MKAFNYFFLLFFITIFFYQCQAPEVQSLDQKTFFDLKAFLDIETERLKERKTAFSKTITLNGYTETKLIEKPDFEIEFSEFYNSDINRSAWLDKYEETKDEIGIHYQAKDEQLEVKEMHISAKGQEISIVKKSQNMLNNAIKEMSYDSTRGYQIKSIRKSIGESADTLMIVVNYVN